MPSIKDFDKKNKKHTDKKHGKVESETSAEATAVPAASVEATKKRRPGRDSEAAQVPVEAVDMPDVKVVDVETGETMQAQGHSKTEDQTHSQAQNHSNVEADAAATENAPPKIEIKFPGSEILRGKFSMPFEVAESIATDWMNDGKFEGLPLGHPLAQYFAAKGLQKAKKMEKQVLESPVTEKVAMQALQAGMKAQEIISQVRSKIKK